MKITDLRRYKKRVNQINALEEKYEKFSDEELREKTEEFRKELQNGKTLDDILADAFALVREASKRTNKERHYDVQLIAGMALNEGNIAEQKTGEGKTLSATLALYLNALEGRGAHLVTVNDYLAERDATWMGPIFHMLGMSVGLIQQKVSPEDDAAFLFDPKQKDKLTKVSRKEAYLAGITYGKNSEFGFDYLRDNLVGDISQVVQREHHYAIIDEVDYILIDEARTPHIISGPANRNPKYFKLFAGLVAKLKQDTDYTVNEKERNIIFTEEGTSRVEDMLKHALNLDEKPNLYSDKFSNLLPYLHQSLNAHVLFNKDDEYIVDGEEVVIVDEFTGRMLHGRRFSDGLHQAIEAKEGVTVKPENITLATISLQNYFLTLYDKLAGMTGTAATEEKEFQKIYGLDVVVVPTNEPMIREALPDRFFRNEEAKFTNVVEKIKELHSMGRPVLIGTTSIEKSERLAGMLKDEGIEPRVLNAKYHKEEAKIIAQAGRVGAVTVATNMAGRGVDIKLGGDPERLAETFIEDGMDKKEAVKKANEICREGNEKVLQLGGLHVIGTERHESRRIDNQLSGRAGRQGDPGSSQFYISFEDELLRRYRGDDMKKRMEACEMDELTDRISKKLLPSLVQEVQKSAESWNFDMRKHVLQYDTVLNKQREAVYSQRRKLLEMKQEEVNDAVRNLIKDVVSDTVKKYSGKNLDLERILMETNQCMPMMDPNHIHTVSLTALVNVLGLTDKLEQLYEYETRADTVEELMKDDFFRQGLLGLYMRELDIKMRIKEISPEQHEELSKRIRRNVNRERKIFYTHTFVEDGIHEVQVNLPKIIRDLTPLIKNELGDDLKSKRMSDIVANENLKGELLKIYDKIVDKMVNDGVCPPKAAEPVKEYVREKMDETQLPLKILPIPAKRKREIEFLAENHMMHMLIEKGLKDSIVSEGREEKEVTAHLKEVFTPDENRLFPQMYNCIEHLMENYPMKKFKKSVRGVSKQGLIGVRNRRISDALEIKEPAEQGLEKFLTENAYKLLEGKEKEIGDDFHRYGTQIMLKVLDTHWRNHLTELQGVREGIGLRGYGQRDPLVEYTKEAYELYRKMMDSVRRSSLRGLSTLKVVRAVPKKPKNE